MKKKVSELTVDGLNRVVAVMRGWKLTVGADTGTEYWDEPGRNATRLQPPNFVSSPELWWPIAEEHKIDITFYKDGSGHVDCDYHDYGALWSFDFEPKRTGEAVLRCWITNEFGEEVELC